MEHHRTRRTRTSSQADEHRDSPGRRTLISNYDEEKPEERRPVQRGWLRRYDRERTYYIKLIGGPDRTMYRVPGELYSGDPIYERNVDNEGKSTGEENIDDEYEDDHDEEEEEEEEEEQSRSELTPPPSRRRKDVPQDKKLSRGEAMKWVSGATDKQLDILFKKFDEGHYLYPALFERRNALDAIHCIEKIQSVALVHALLKFWTESSRLRCADVIATLEERAKILGGLAGTPPTIDRLESILAAIRRLPLGSDTGEDGCDLRAHTICAGIASRFTSIAIGHLTKIWTFPKTSIPLHATHHWKWHVAPCIRFADGAQLVFDPILFQNEYRAPTVNDRPRSGWPRPR